ncbi:MAG: heme o synthase [bacterium]|nr:heme o synthase [bacterium]
MRAAIVLDYIQLTKPRILLLVALTGFVALLLEGNAGARPWWTAGVLFMIALSGGAANSFNQFFERTIDAQMERTRQRRPLPQGKISPTGAFVFSLSLSFISVLSLAWMANWLAALLALGTIFFYSCIYTLWLKPRTPYNIVIGGAAGAAAPLIAWGAVRGEIALPLILFLIVFIWTPPHFWALSLHFKKDYEKVKIPMLPLVRGDEETRRQILLYSLVLIPTTLLLVPFGGAGWIYLASAAFLGGIFLKRAVKLRHETDNRSAFSFFRYSIIYLFVLLLMLTLDYFFHFKVF